MEEIDLKELFDFFLDRLGLLIIITISVCLLGSIYGMFLQTPMYQSYTTIILGSNESAATTSITQSDVTLNKNLVDTYAEIVKSRRVLDQVIEELDLDTSYSALSNQISVSALNDTEIIKITVHDDDPVRAKNIANVTANVFTKEIVKLYNMNNVNILDEAIKNDNPYNINVIKQVIIYLMIGFVLGAGLLFIIYYFDRTIKTTEQIEQKIKLPILGSVEEMSKGGK